MRSLVKYFSTLEEKFRISAQACNILYRLKFIIEKKGEKRRIKLPSLPIYLACQTGKFIVPWN